MTRLISWLGFLSSSVLFLFPVLGIANTQSSYTYMVDEPSISGQPVLANNLLPFYNDLLTITQASNPFPVNRLIFKISNFMDPSQGQVFNPANPSNNYGYQLLTYLASAHSSSFEVYAELDVETKYPTWSQSWVMPASAPSVGACGSLKSGSIPPGGTGNNSDEAKTDMLKSICLVQSINQALGTPVIKGVVYDNQGSIYQFTDVPPAHTDIDWLMTQAHGSGLNLGWIGGGFQPVDLSILEIYDLDKGSKPRVDTVVPASEYTFSGYPAGTVFPGDQVTNEVSPNIYQCAIASTDAERAQLGCGSAYTKVNSALLSPDIQMQNSFNEIYNNDPGTPLSPHVFFGATLPANTQNTKVLILLSTQYSGPMGSDGGYCRAASGNCACVASAYDSLASCGDENGFGSWLNQKDAVTFNTFAQNLTAQVCAPGFTCEPAIFTYDYMPQSWFRAK